MKRNTATVIDELAAEPPMVPDLGLPLADIVDCALAFLKAFLIDYNSDSNLEEFFEIAITFALGSGAVNPDDSLIFIGGHGHA
jgi:hypothetical protein